MKQVSDFCTILSYDLRKSLSNKSCCRTMRRINHVESLQNIFIKPAGNSDLFFLQKFVPFKLASFPRRMKFIFFPVFRVKIAQDKKKGGNFFPPAIFRYRGLPAPCEPAQCAQPLPGNGQRPSRSSHAHPESPQEYPSA